MFFRLTCFCFLFCTFVQVNCTFGSLKLNGDSTSTDQSLIGNMLRHKAEFFDHMKQRVHQIFNGGNRALKNNLQNLGNSVASTADSTHQLINQGAQTSKKYAQTVVEGITLLPRTVMDLIKACHNNNYIDSMTALTLSYVNGRPPLLYQFVTEDGRILPITEELAHQLIPNFSLENPPEDL